MFVVVETAKRLGCGAINAGRRPAQDSDDGDDGDVCQCRRRCRNVCAVMSVGGSAFIRKSACGASANVEGEGAAGMVEGAECCGADVSRACTAVVGLGRISHGWRGRIAMRSVEQQSGQQSAAIAVLRCVVVLLRRGCFQDAPVRCILGQPSEHHPCQSLLS
jgi:hypothetical protein